jgi:hypothetical protein
VRSLVGHVPPYLVCDGILLASALNGAILSAVKERFLRSGVLILIGLVTGCPGGVDREISDEMHNPCTKPPPSELARGRAAAGCEDAAEARAAGMAGGSNKGATA